MLVQLEIPELTAYRVVSVQSSAARECKASEVSEASCVLM